jgi:hypothetical protein
LWEAFLLQMNDFDRFLEVQLRQMLDPVAMSQPPARRGRLEKPQTPILAIAPAGAAATVELAAESFPVVEPAVVTVPVASAPQL